MFLNAVGVSGRKAVHHKTRLARSCSHQTTETRWDHARVLRNAKVNDHDSLVALKIRHRVYLDLRHRVVGATSAIENPHADGSRSEIGRDVVGVEGRGAVGVEACTFSVCPFVVRVSASMAVWAGLWDENGEALLLLGLLLVHGLDEFLVVLRYNLKGASKLTIQFKNEERVIQLNWCCWRTAW